MKLIQGVKTFDIDRRKFNGGEINIQVPIFGVNVEGTAGLHAGTPVRIIADLRSSDDVMELLMVVDALRRALPGTPLKATLPYIPYGRQDRVCNAGEALSLRVMCSLINSCRFTEVTILDPHSEVTPALINNVRVLSQADMLRSMWPVIERKYGKAILVSPDAGSNKKMAENCKVLGKTTFLRADKTRDLSTGEILETVVYANNLKGNDCLIVDDLCDGGRTFIELAKKLKQLGARKVGLYVSHGIFSQGKKVFDDIIDDVYTSSDWNE